MNNNITTISRLNKEIVNIIDKVNYPYKEVFIVSIYNYIHKKIEPEFTNGYEIVWNIIKDILIKEQEYKDKISEIRRKSGSKGGKSKKTTNKTDVFISIQKSVKKG